jgi:hypothetical protein
MLTDRDFCRALKQSCGTERHLVVAKLVDAALIHRTTSIPTTALASRRFEVGVLASVTNWIVGGPLSEDHVGMLFDEEPGPDIYQAIRSSLEAFGFADPWSGRGRIDLSAVVVAVPLAEAASLADVFHTVKHELAGASIALTLGDQMPDRVECWCKDDRD